MQDLAHLEPLAKDLPQTKRGHDRCIALLVSATELFLEHSYDAVSLDDIVQHAGGSKASIYKYFGNKEGLFKAICDYRRERFFEQISIPIELMALDFRRYLVETLLNFYHQIMTPENSAFMRLVFEQSQRNPDLALHIHQRGPVHVQTSIANALEQADAKGVLRCENPMYSAQLYFGILRNLEWRILMGIQEEESDEEITKYIHYCVDRFLEGHQKV
ncbi:TetR/AcrR family transcriptional regulator [Acinetobacter bohemicus]|uniref:TetR/AcrR family transcriptional regulator n=1 Tax=Acinetobacter TaxID=469 RepID=UPI00116BD432|nr:MULTISPECIES: TetR/AcrR family transcriptional regulator [Acinetobacter]MDM1782105.1 TetR/AcrR family transcriptional regulator [Acinetobacter indicus]MCO8042805.1 TetR/AcrR family transcriptional regulator [Acinetobacter sp. S4400-12]MCU7225140.1 TetR/AcrR family transcriptional regulator [Acinetobacter bohemicus]QKQ70140.1 TetR/AcrR family transcriptional regulator [Acinetobacter sp. 10FS3-1]TQR62043.1 TetR/AcrR family transcriptional regulator [Acinetobacter sp. RF14B]